MTTEQTYYDVESEDHFYSLLDECSENNHLMVVDFYTTWCGPCKQLSPVFASVSKNMASENVKFVKVDCEKNDELSEKYSVSSIPTLKYFVDKSCVYSENGARTEDQLKETVQKYLNSLKDLENSEKEDKETDDGDKSE